jgi:hypothetical protein
MKSDTETSIFGSIAKVQSSLFPQEIDYFFGMNKEPFFE